MLKIIVEKIDNELIKAANDFSDFRERVKHYLQIHGRAYDKFTVTNNDSFLGFVSEYIIRNYMIERYSKYGIYCERWEDKFDIIKINKIVDNNLSDMDSLNYVEEYFYDRFDLIIGAGDKQVYIDVKSAITQKEPTENWNFLYPIVQNNISGKDYIVLGYYVTNSIDRNDFREFVLCGCYYENDLRNCEIQKKGTYTRYQTKSQIDNYITEVKDYKDIDVLIKNEFNISVGG